MELRIKDVASDFIPKNIYRFNQIRYPNRSLFRVESQKNDTIGYATLIAPVISSKSAAEWRSEPRRRRGCARKPWSEGKNNTGESRQRETKGVHAAAKRRLAKWPREPLCRGSEDLDRKGVRSRASPLSGIFTKCRVQL